MRCTTVFALLGLIFFPVLLPLCAAQAAEGKKVFYTVADEQFEGYYIEPAANAPLVYLIHDWDGLTAYEIKRAQMLAELGYSVFAADLYGAGIRPTALEDKRKQTAALYANRERMRSLLNGGLEAARKEGANMTDSVAMGYCFGGATILELARSGAPMKGFVSFHGSFELPTGQHYDKVQGKILVLHGSADTAVSLQDFAELANTLEKSGKPHEMITYSGAPHAFTVFGSEAYREDADTLSWQRFIAFLKETLR